MELRDAADEHRLGQRAEPACQLRAREAQLIGDQVQVVDVVLATRRVRQALGARLRPTVLRRVNRPILTRPGVTSLSHTETRHHSLSGARPGETRSHPMHRDGRRRAP